MTSRAFQPGFRMSVVDGLVLIVAAIAAWLLADKYLPFAVCVLAVVFAFFLFCNVFRVARSLELIWAASFVLMTILFHGNDWPSLPLFCLMAFVLTVGIIGIQLTRSSYHGVGWRWINPNLREWWERNQH